MENALLQDMVKMNKEKCGSSDVVTDVSSHITGVPSFPPLPVNMQFNRPNFGVIVKNG